MRIAYFTNTYPRATDTFIRREVIGLRARGFEIFTYSVRKVGVDHDQDEEVISEKKKTQYILPVSFIYLFLSNLSIICKKPICYIFTAFLASKTSKPGIKGHLLQIIYFFEAVILATFIEKDRIEHIHNHLGDSSGTVTMLAAKLTGIPYSISIHGPHIFFDGMNWALGKKTQYSKFIACIGYFCVSQMMFYTDKNYWSKFKIIRCGIDINKFKYRAPAGKAKTIIYVGRLAKEKGISILFSSLSILINQGYDVELDLFGDGPDRLFLHSLAKEMKIDNQITFHGYVDQYKIAQALYESHIFVLPSFAEGIPVALMEAMAIGVPVIATYVGGVNELIVDQYTGQLVFPSDSLGLAQAIARYIDNPEFCKIISVKGREMVEKNFNIDDQLEKLGLLFVE